jgi:hypothetical protein
MVKWLNRALTPALSHPMGEGESFPVWLEQSRRWDDCERDLPDSHLQ